MGSVLGGLAKVAVRAGSAVASAAKPILTGVSAVKNNFLKPLASKVVPLLEPLGNAAYLANQVKGLIPSGDSGGVSQGSADDSANYAPRGRYDAYGGSGGSGGPGRDRYRLGPQYD